MSLSKKDYIAIADILNEAWKDPADYYSDVPEIVNNLADYFQSENGLFDKEKFLERVYAE